MEMVYCAGSEHVRVCGSLTIVLNALDWNQADVQTIRSVSIPVILSLKGSNLTSLYLGRLLDLTFINMIVSYIFIGINLSPKVF